MLMLHPVASHLVRCIHNNSFPGCYRGLPQLKHMSCSDMEVTATALPACKAGFLVPNAHLAALMTYGLWIEFLGPFCLHLEKQGP